MTAAPTEPVRHVIVEYHTAPERTDENQALAEAVFEELARDRPDGVRYAAFRLEDGVTFVHVAQIASGGGTNPLNGVEAFAAFGRDIAARCDVPPAVRSATLVGAYRCFEPEAESRTHHTKES